jgi:hypothetical protein
MRYVPGHRLLLLVFLPSLQPSLTGCDPTPMPARCSWQPSELRAVTVRQQAREALCGLTNEADK